jgi:hypothetical protein
MSSPLGDEVDRALAHLKEVREAGEKASKLLADASHTEMSKRRLFSVTVGIGGELQALTFNGETYRTLAPAELAQLIVETVTQARTAVRDEASETLSEVWPIGGKEFNLLTTASNLEELMDGFMKSAGTGFSPDEIAEFENWKAES